ncbi:SDR family NAD(P)-dependent oxidoreductase [Nonomuraea bangladeshensis]|uniref:SDR family NAD(P)-dependent oxidoreductase n=1 Tax=Nonomuraea bangladeshensis TaxID=404385 RepID=A0ABV3HKQ9_9ACTN
MPQTVDLTGQTAVVTGCSSGLGRRFAVTLAEHGASVVAVARRADRLGELADEIAAAGGACLPLAADLTDDDQLGGLLDAAEERFGTATILVNNAGIPDAQHATKMPVDLVDRVLGTNLRAPWLLSCDFARRLIAAGAGGRVVNVSSMGAYEYRGGGAALYSVTKAAVVRMTEVLAVEWAKFHINVNAIAPGAFASEMMDGMVRRIGGDPSRFFPRARMGDPRQLDSTLLYLVSPHSEFVTGTVVKVDDGQGAR